MFADKVLRLALTAAHRLLRQARSARKRRPGVHAVAFTPERKLILVKLRYATGWRLPGGGRAEDEDIGNAALRELREEIGMIAHGAVRTAARELMIVENVRYAPRKWSWEVEQVGEFALDDLPRDLSRFTAHWLAALRDNL